MAILTIKEKIVEELTRKYLKRITTDCIELSPKVEDAFEIRREVLNKIISLTEKE